MERELKKRSKEEFTPAEKATVEKLREVGMKRMADAIEFELLSGYTLGEIFDGLSDTQEIIKDAIWLNSPPVGNEVI